MLPKAWQAIIHGVIKNQQDWATNTFSGHRKQDNILQADKSQCQSKTDDKY